MISIERKKLEKVLDALETYKGFIDDAHITEGQWHWIDGLDNVQIVIKEALAQDELCSSQEPVAEEPTWIVNNLGELGVKVGCRFFFLYKGGNIEYGENDEGETALHGDGTPMLYRIVGKREFGETCWPLKWVQQGRRETRYAVDLKYIPGLSFGKPEDGDWKPLPVARNIKE